MTKMPPGAGTKRTPRLLQPLRSSGTDSCYGELHPQKGAQ
jgi:hypothetical protein